MTLGLIVTFGGSILLVGIAAAMYMLQLYHPKYVAQKHIFGSAKDTSSTATGISTVETVAEESVESVSYSNVAHKDRADKGEHSGETIRDMPESAAQIHVKSNEKKLHVALSLWNLLNIILVTTSVSLAIAGFCIVIFENLVLAIFAGGGSFIIIMFGIAVLIINQPSILLQIYPKIWFVGKPCEQVCSLCGTKFNNPLSIPPPEDDRVSTSSSDSANQLCCRKCKTIETPICKICGSQLDESSDVAI